MIKEQNIRQLMPCNSFNSVATITKFLLICKKTYSKVFTSVSFDLWNVHITCDWFLSLGNILTSDIAFTFVTLFVKLFGKRC